MNEKQRHIGDLLRAADREIKNSNLELAMAYIHRIFELELKNVYAKAYRERIISLLESQGMSRQQAEQKALSIVAADLQIAKQEEPKQQPVPPSPPVPVRSVVPSPQTVIATPAKTVLTPVHHQPSPPAPPQRPVSPVSTSSVRKIKRSAASSEAYRTLLLEIWKDGSVSPEEQTRVDAMRETFAISPEEHATFESEVRHSTYLHAIKEEWSKGITNFEPLRKRFLISDSEQIAIEPKVFQLLQSLQSKGSVLVLDDEEPFLRIIKGLLDEGGYYCFTSQTGEEGLQLLETMTPDIVICDINFSKPNMSGFAFYEKFRSIDKFLTTPFIFLSGLDQDVLVRTGKKLGADDYLFKPVDTEMLLATVEGKLRRSRELKRAL
ncbi:MAG: response regulator [Bacteriovoracaceae bacterium]|nr:response regulator [Bacteroidota bacterium]